MQKALSRSRTATTEILLEYFYDEDVNRKHMKGYVPIRAHREAFTELVKAQLPDKENKDFRKM